MSDTFTIIDESRATDVAASIDGDRVRVAPADIERALGWTLEPEGFCRSGVCVPVHDRAGVVIDGHVDVAAFAGLLGRPLALDIDERAAAIGAAPEDRATSLASLEAPDFTLPDLEGRMHTLSAHRGKKVFLAVWASW